jgi:hypothetical protein
MTLGYRFSVSAFVVLIAMGTASTAALAELKINPYPDAPASAAVETVKTNVQVTSKAVDKADAGVDDNVINDDIKVKEEKAPVVLTKTIRSHMPATQTPPAASKPVSFLTPTKEQVATGGVIYRPVSFKHSEHAAPKTAQTAPQNKGLPISDALKEELKAELRRELRMEMAKKSMFDDHKPLNDADALVVSTHETPEHKIFLPNPATDATKKSPELFGRMLKDLANIETAAGADEGPDISAISMPQADMDAAAARLQNLEPSAGHPVDITHRPNLQERGLVAIQVPERRQRPAAQKKTTMREWSFSKGQNLRDVLGVWSQKAGVNMIWSIPKDYTVPQTVSINGTYEQAVQALLEQYSLNADRPLGSLHVDSQGTQRTLVIQTQG